MRVITSTCATAREFLAAIEPDFAEREVEHHLILGVTHGLIARPVSGTAFVAVRDDAGLALAALLSPSRPLLIATNRTEPDAAITELARWLLEHGHTPRGFIADLPHAERFAREWEPLRGGHAQLKMRQRLHVLRDVAAIPNAKGALRQAALSDLDLLSQWQGAFNNEALGETLDPELRDALARRVDNGEMFLWEDAGGGPLSMAASARPTPGGVAINSVYTPPEWRGRGYATTCVAALSQHLLQGGKAFCVLYTDLANPTSNAIYARIGYRPVSDSLFYALTQSES